MESPLNSLIDAYWSNFTLFALWIPVLLIVSSHLVLRRNNKELHFLRTQTITVVCVVVIITGPIIANYVYPFHVIGRVGSCFAGEGKPGFVPRGIIHHPSKAEIQNIAE
jgi:hypothetical protein